MATMEKSVVDFERRDEIGLITLNNPAQAQRAVARRAGPVDRAAAKRPRPTAEVQVRDPAGRGTGVQRRARPERDRRGDRRRARESLFALCSQTMLTIRGLSLPVIAEVQGLATAAGCQLAATCDLIVAAEEASFATPGIKIGLFCSTPAVALSRAVGPEEGDGDAAHGRADLGPRGRAHRPGQSRRAARAIGRGHAASWPEQIAAASPYTLGLGKRAFYEQLGLATEQAYQLTEQIMVENARAPDAIEGMKAFLEHRPPRWGASVGSPCSAGYWS